MSLFSLIVGSVILDESSLEVPDRLDALGGRQAIEEHEFPGGLRTQQSFGWFPRELVWQAWLSGTFAMFRVHALEAIAVAGREVRVTYGPRSWMGLVTDFHAVVHHQWLIQYKISFAPRIDLSNPPSGSLTGGMSGGSILGAQTGILSSLMSGFPLAMPSGLTNPTGALLSLVSSGMGNAGGVLGNLSPSSIVGITTAATTLISLATPLVASASPTTSYMASSARDAAVNVSNVVSQPSAPSRTLQVINPDLPALAAQYLGDANRWQSIAAVNGLVDPQPRGSFRLIIPA